eukprot:CAMPEP_0194490708 /NCGR_PEP_ID=MMETSP0253-20130528/9833_1 /TAXON_ID=2966 /ORGANISM="Noctiluca scintillans" /LENGTH=199 /DNA_ID=CAMNT_0039331365 /DNA_START=72 /DNA_END=671 /DNA_ORIENTATION=-
MAAPVFMFLIACSVFPLDVHCRHLRQESSAALYATITPADEDLLADDNPFDAQAVGHNHTEPMDVESAKGTNSHSAYIESDIDNNFLTDANNTLEELSFGRNESRPKSSQLSKPTNSTYIEAREEALRKDENFFDNVYPVDANNDLFNFTLQRERAATDARHRQTAGTSHDDDNHVKVNVTGNSTGEADGETVDQSTEA